MAKFEKIFRKVTFPKFEDKLARVESFYDWPVQLNQTSEEMAEAGFFYTRQSDLV